VTSQEGEPQAKRDWQTELVERSGCSPATGTTKKRHREVIRRRKRRQIDRRRRFFFSEPKSLRWISVRALLGRPAFGTAEPRQEPELVERSG